MKAIILAFTADITMINYARMTALSITLALYATCCPAMEMPTPEGEWLVKDKRAHIRVVECDRKLWGVISWVIEPGTDRNNPDASKRSRPIIGVPILLGMQPDENGEWKGDIYNADNGKVYKSHIRLKSADTLHVEGCMLGGLFCGGEDWTRLDVTLSQKIVDDMCRQLQARS